LISAVMLVSGTVRGSKVADSTLSDWDAFFAHGW